MTTLSKHTHGLAWAGLGWVGLGWVGLLPICVSHTKRFFFFFFFVCRCFFTSVTDALVRIFVRIFPFLCAASKTKKMPASENSLPMSENQTKNQQKSRLFTNEFVSKKKYQKIYRTLTHGMSLVKNSPSLPKLSSEKIHLEKQLRDAMENLKALGLRMRTVVHGTELIYL
jgi:hypothetical protein